MSKPVKKFFIPRPDELRLLIPAVVIVTLGFWMIQLSKINTGASLWTDGLIPLSLALAAFLAHGILVAAGSRADSTILPVLTVLTGFGLLFQYRLSDFGILEWQSPAIWSAPAVLLLAAISAVVVQGKRISVLKKTVWLWAAIGFAVPLGVIITGVNYRGGMYGPGKTTPTECVKPLMVIVLSYLLCRYGAIITRKKPIWTYESGRAHLILLGVWAIPQVLFIQLRDLGMIAAMGILLIVMLSAASGRKMYAIAGAVGTLICGFAFKTWIPKGQVRFEAWLDPFAHPADSGYQIIQSLFALFHGAFFGRGAGSGFPQNIPLASTDFVHAAISEEFGLAGAALLLIGLLYLAHRGFFWASKTRDAFSALIAVGAATLICSQTLLNVGGVVKLIPMTGVPLPFISRGGAAALAFAVIAGWIMAVSHND